MRFCPGCGKGLAAHSPKRYGVVLGAAVVLFGATFGLKSAMHWKRGDAKPTEHFQAPREEVAVDPELEALRLDLERAPNDIGILRQMAAFLGDKLRNRPDAPSPLVFEAVDVLSRILTISPDDPDALLMMGDVSFDQKAFTKAVEFYERYLKLMPNDLGATARYASTLTFLGRYDDSIKQLDSVLVRDPNNFPAMAYLAITFAQKGDTSKARELGTKALQLAPSEEARARFSGFIQSLSTQPEGVSQTPAQPQTAKSSTGGVESGISGFITALKNNPVAGPKFVRYDDSTSGEVKLVFRDFPMAQMPPFAKEKFFGGLKSGARAAGLKDGTMLVFVDDSSGAEMERLGL
jgi:tetratricopeptide (TPR) repeat protein